MIPMVEVIRKGLDEANERLRQLIQTLSRFYSSNKNAGKDKLFLCNTSRRGKRAQTLHRGLA